MGMGCAAVEGVGGAAVRMVDLVRAVRVAAHAGYDEEDSELFPNQLPSSQPKERTTSDELTQLAILYVVFTVPLKSLPSSELKLDFRVVTFASHIFSKVYECVALVTSS